MASNIPSIPYPDGMTPPTPSAGSGTVLPPLPSLPAIGSSTSSTSADDNVAADIAAGGTGLASEGGIGSSKGASAAVSATVGGVWGQLGAWLKSIALPGTFAVVALLLIVLSVYIAVTQHGGVVLPSK